MQQGVFESRGREVDEGFRSSEHAQRERGARDIAGGAQREQQARRCRESQRERCGRVVGLARDCVRDAHEQHPQRIRVGLDALGDVPARSVAFDEVVDDAERDVGVVAGPRALQREQHERRDEDRKQHRVEARAGHFCVSGARGGHAHLVAERVRPGERTFARSSRQPPGASSSSTPAVRSTRTRKLAWGSIPRACATRLRTTL